MREVNEYAMVDEPRCIGDRICENICPSGAITVMERKAKIDEDKFGWQQIRNLQDINSAFAGRG
jgi:Fe-S-cluster-containing hydrogenase component 2